MKYEKEFPLVSIKVDGLDNEFDLSDIEGRKEYFRAKAGDEIDKLNKYFSDGNTFIAYMLGKKNAGKGTYTKLMAEIFGKDKISHVSFGDIVRDVHKAMEDPESKEELISYLKQHYRGYISVEEALDALLGRSTETLLPTEFTLALVKREIDQMDRKTLFIDGFPRDLDQVSYSLYFRDLINYRYDPDVFVGIDIPESVIDSRIKTRVICPKCKTPRSIKLMATKEVGWDEDKEEYFLKCDNPECGNERMIKKEGDDLGIEAIRDRLEKDGMLIDKALNLHGIPKVLLRNAIPSDKAKDLVDDYEITPEFYYEGDSKSKDIKVLTKPWTVKDDEGIEVYSLMAPALVVILIKQLVKALDIS